MSDMIRDRNGEMIPAPDGHDATPTCCCDGSGFAETVTIDGRDVVKICTVCKSHLAGVPTVAQRHAGHGFTRRRRLRVVR